MGQSFQGPLRLNVMPRRFDGLYGVLEYSTLIRAFRSDPALTKARSSYCPIRASYLSPDVIGLNVLPLLYQRFANCLMEFL